MIVLNINRSELKVCHYHLNLLHMFFNSIYLFPMKIHCHTFNLIEQNANRAMNSIKIDIEKWRL